MFTVNNLRFEGIDSPVFLFYTVRNNDELEIIDVLDEEGKDIKKQLSEHQWHRVITSCIDAFHNECKLWEDI